MYVCHFFHSIFLLSVNSSFFHKLQINSKVYFSPIFSGLSKELYSLTKWDHWHEFYAIHLLARHREYLVPEDVKESKIEDFNETNIQNYKKTFGEIARSIWNHPKVQKHWRPYPT